MSSDDDDDDFSFKSNNSSVIEVRKPKKSKTKAHESDDDFLFISTSTKENQKRDKAKSLVQTTNSKTSLPSSTSGSSLTSHKSSTIQDLPGTTTTQSISNSIKAVSENSWRGPDITTESSAKALITKYLMHQNRPYSVIQVYENLHKRIQKPTIERSLNTLCELSSVSSSGTTNTRIICKEYGKAKIYFPDQNCFQTMSERDMKQLEIEIDLLQQQVDRKMMHELQLNSKVVSMSAEPSDIEIDRYVPSIFLHAYTFSYNCYIDNSEKITFTTHSEIREFESRVRTKAALLNDMKSLGPVNPRDFENAIREHNKTRILWKERKVSNISVHFIIISQ